MIEKKRPIAEDISDTDQEETSLDMHGQNGFEDEALHEDPLYPEYEEGAHDPDSLEIDPEAEAAARKRKANLIFYGGLAAAVVVIGYLGYPQIKRTFFKEQPHQTAAGIPVPLKARESKFKLADTTAPSQAPGGAIATPPAGAMPDTSNPAPTADTSATGPAAPSVAVAPPPVVVAAPPAVTPQQTMTAPAQMAPVQGASVSAPPFQPVSSTPGANAADQAHMADLDGKISALQASIASLNADKQQTATALQQIESSLDSLQKQVAAIDTAKTKAPEIAGAPIIPKAVSHRVHAQAGSSNWTLRSAMTGMALLGQAGSSDLKRVSVGDTVPGLGKILSISEQNGQWIVKGTSGSVVQ